MHGHPLAGHRAGTIDDRAKRGGEATAEARRGDEVEIGGEWHEVRIGVTHLDELGERAPVGEAGLRVGVADLMVSRSALRADAAAARERRGDAVADPPAAHARADGGHHAGELVAGHVRRPHVRVVAHPAVPVTPTDAAGPHRHDRGVVARSWHGHVANGERSPEFGEDRGTHRRLVREDTTAHNTSQSKRMSIEGTSSGES